MKDYRLQNIEHTYQYEEMSLKKSLEVSLNACFYRSELVLMFALKFNLE